MASILGNLSLTGAWVAILAARGYSLIKIGIAETVFHIFSLTFEIPSGVFADVFGRKQMLVVSSIMRVIGSICMICSKNLTMVCVAIACFAVSYNFSSGSGDALAYDSLKLVGEEVRYERYASNQLILYRLCNGISTLCAGFALFVGYKIAYASDILVTGIQIGVLLSLREIHLNHTGAERKQAVLQSVWKELRGCFVESLRFLKESKRAVFLMTCNSFVGAVDIVLLFFLQAKLPQTGMPDSALGIALFIMEMGGILGAKLILQCKKLRYRWVFVITSVLVLCGVLIEHTGVAVLMTLGGFVAACSDDALQVRTDAILQEMFPSEQRAITSPILICIGSISIATTNASSLPSAPAYILPLSEPSTITLPLAITLPPGLTSPRIIILLSDSRI